MPGYKWIASIFAILLAGCLIQDVVQGTLQNPAPTDELRTFAEKLLLEHNYLLPENLRRELDELHRELRILETPRNPPRVSRRRLARAGLRDAAEGLLGSLERKFIDVSLGRARLTAAPDSPLMLAGDIGAILLRVNAHLEDPHYVVHDFDFSRDKLPLRIETVAGSANWILVHLTNVPPGTTTITLDLGEPATETLRLALRVRRPDTGRLSVRIVEAGTGNPLPAMVNLIWKLNGKEKKPAGAIELSDQFDSQGWPTGRRHTNLPGKLEGRFWWVVPEPFDMELSPGPWEITVRRGLEYLPVSQSLEIKPGEETEVTLKLSRWVEMARQGWYSGDDHVHAQIQSDSDAEDLMAWLQAEDLRLANIVEMSDIFRTYFEQRGFGRQHRYEEQGRILSPGQECPRTNQLGHTLSMNTTSMVRYPDQYFLYDLVFDQVHDQGGLSGYAHADTGAFHLHRGHEPERCQRKS